MPPIPTIQHRKAHNVEEDFLELVLADEQLLRDEFDAIIAEDAPLENTNSRADLV